MSISRLLNWCILPNKKVVYSAFEKIQFFEKSSANNRLNLKYTGV